MTENAPAHTAPFVVVGVDGSAASDAALLLAAREAQLRSAVLCVVAAHDVGAVAFSYAGGFDMGMEIGPLEDGLRLAAETLVKDATDTVATRLPGAPVEVRTTVARGRPSQVLLEAATGAELLVVGARGAGAWARLVLGSTSSEVVHHAHLPVLVVPSPPEAS